MLAAPRFEQSGGGGIYSRLKLAQRFIASAVNMATMHDGQIRLGSAWARH
tara:strand:- start:6670 stop:6819 length:150 start_codon:yes stop_codon:yes gene_type:complete